MSVVLKISKAAEPACLSRTRADYRKVHKEITKDAWASLTGGCKQTMREASWQEQGGLCAYCMSPLKSTRAADSSDPAAGGMTLEHFEARHDSGPRTLDWDNLLGVCPGVVVGNSVDDKGVQEEGQFHCDRHRGTLAPDQQPLTYNPAAGSAQVQTRLSYTSMGEVRSDDEAMAGDLEVLQLNRARLCRNRKSVLDAVKAALDRDARPATVRRRLNDWAERDTDGRLRSYAGVGLWYLAKKVRALGK